MPILNLNEGVPRTFHSARNLNARVTRTCFENILPGSCTENIYERALLLNHEVPGLNLLAVAVVSLGKALNRHCLVPLVPWLLAFFISSLLS